MKKNRKRCVIFYLSFMVIILCGCNTAVEKPINKIETEFNKVENESLEEIKNQEEQEDFEEELNKLNDISKYSYIVKGNGEIDVEIISSDNYAKEKWIIEIINEFNEEKNLVDGKTVSISLKSMPSEIVFEDIVSGKHIPDAIIPKNYFLPEILTAKNIEFYQEEEILLKNMLGFVIDEKFHNFLIKNYEDVNLYSIQQTVMKDGSKIGIINDYINSLDFVIPILYSFDRQDLLSDVAIKQFKQFKNNLVNVTEKKYVSEYLNRENLNGIILDYNSYLTILELEEYIFIPFGVINNNPLYCNQNISEQEKRILKLFGYYATSLHAKKLAEHYGFIIKGNYISDVPFIEGQTLLEIEEILNCEN